MIPIASVHDALLMDVLLRPDDDTPRLILADWLEDEGQADRANFIRLQLALARLEASPCHCSGPDPTGCSRCREGTRTSRLASGIFSHHGWRWLALRDHAFDRFGICHPTLWRLGMDCYSTDWKQVFRRGLVESVEMTTTGFLDHAESLFSQHPITEVRLTGKAGVGWHHDEPDSPGYRWHGWSPGNPVQEDDDITHRLFDLLANGRRDPSRKNALFYDTQEAALTDLSQACVKYGRNRVGLPPL